MSTRCIVEIKDSSNKNLKPITLYHHHDGYPFSEYGVCDDLLKRFYDVDKDELNVSYIDDVVNTLVKDVNDEYEVTAYNHGDIEYKYTIDVATKSLKCESVDNWDCNMKVIQRFTFVHLVNDYKKRYGIGVTPITNKQIKAIHAVVNELGFADSRYRQVLDSLFNTTSCKELTEQQASILIETLNKLKG